ncbi:mannitol dehydrogenase family protein [Gryllotalpicola reticulitermitis]|uniref:Mannitol-1-phosphate 5-dehydrogenase n=1 Tax=Gryllotalpicola reticulitermitis TaxID=1184153 RepID=A0ABV8QC57_9MICO
MSASGVKQPQYDRSSTTVGIVHFGVGGFHRAHQAMVVDTLMNEGKALDWAICGVGVLPHDRAMRDALAAQDCLYTLVLKHEDGTREARTIGSIKEYLFAPDDPDRVIERMADPAVRIVSLTITEGGYNTNQVTGEFDDGNPDVVADLADGVRPRTVFGLVTEALRRRRQRGVAPFTIMSCDNIQGNGGVAARAFTRFASLRDPELGDWIERNVSFPNSMVDRITPVTTDEDRQSIAAEFSVTDAWPVVAEPFFQWVLEDAFPLGRPPYEEAGVQVVGDVEPYELMKLRLLNAGHQAIAYFGVLAGYTYAHEAARDPLFVGLLRRYWSQEARPTLRPVPGVDLDEYTDELLQRFGNEYVRDTLARLATDSSDRIPKWLLPVVRDQLAAGGEVDAAAAIVASWARYAEGVDETGNPISIVDRYAAERHAAALEQAADPLAFVRDESLFGSLAAESAFTEPYLRTLALLQATGARAALKALAD